MTKSTRTINKQAEPDEAASNPRFNAKRIDDEELSTFKKLELAVKLQVIQEVE